MYLLYFTVAGDIQGCFDPRKKVWWNVTPFGYLIEDFDLFFVFGVLRIHVRHDLRQGTCGIRKRNDSHKHEEHTVKPLDGVLSRNVTVAYCRYSCNREIQSRPVPLHHRYIVRIILLFICAEIDNNNPEAGENVDRHHK